MQTHMFKTVPFDKDTEFHYFKFLERCFPANCYFVTPFRSWEHGSNENLNGLIRQYIQKGLIQEGRSSSMRPNCFQAQRKTAEKSPLQGASGGV
jgi:IS30 family transposase